MADEYIKREAAENAIRNDLPLSTWMKRSVDKAMHSMGVTVDAIDTIPAADVELVRHGRWSMTKDGAAYCSACKRKMNPYLYGYARCAMCGARMDGGDE